MTLRTIILSISLIICNSLKAQEPATKPTLDNNPDSMRNATVNPQTTLHELNNHSNYQQTPLHTLELIESQSSPSTSLSAPSFQPSSPFMPIASWHNGNISASTQSTDYIGLMANRSATVTLSQQWGISSLWLSASADRYAYFRGLQNQYSLGAKLEVALTDWLKFSTFGNISSPVHPLSPAMNELMGSSMVGGSFRFDFSPTWGLEVGAQSIQSPLTRQWHTRPIVAPHFKYKKIDIGIDLGGIFYESIKSYIDQRNFNNRINQINKR